jgi:hypothetical protein
MTDGSRAIDDQYLFGRHAKVTVARLIWTTRIEFWPNGSLPADCLRVFSQQSIGLQHAGKSQSTGGESGGVQEVAAIEKSLAKWR